MVAYTDVIKICGKEKLKRIVKKIILLGLSKQDILSSFFCAIVLTLVVFLYLPDISRIIPFFVFLFVISCIGVRLYDNSAAFINILTFGSMSSTLYPSVICVVCHAVVLRSKNEKCECGGSYEPFDNWKWEEDEIEESEQTN